MKKKIDNLDDYLNSLFGKKTAEGVPSESFMTYLGNKLDFEFSRQVLGPSGKKSPVSAQISVLNWRLAFISCTIFIAAAGLLYFSKAKSVSHLTNLDASVSDIGQELTYLDAETQEAITSLDENLDEELESILKL